MRRAALAVVALAGAARPSLAYCPCYDTAAVPNSFNCGVAAVANANPSTAQWVPIFQLLAGGPQAWGASGPPPSAINAATSTRAAGTIGQGCVNYVFVPATFSCEVLEAIGMQESGWRQFCVPDQPANEVGLSERTIVAVDCGYGISQVTSGMHVGESPAFDRARVAGEGTYNLATGAAILAIKWNATNCVGNNQPKLVEDWYSAVWGYNGLTASNNPNNANYDAMRTACNPSVGCSARPYQEKVWGWMEFPPTAGHWAALAPAYPNRGDIGMTTPPPNLPEPACAGPTDCINTRAVHTSSCAGTAAVDLGVSADLAGADASGSDASAAVDLASGDAAVIPTAASDLARDATLIAGPAPGCGCELGAPSSSHRAAALVALLVILFVVGRRASAA